MISLGDVSCGHFPASSLGDILLQKMPVLRTVASKLVQQQKVVVRLFTIMLFCHISVQL